ncbi:hypothetical protein P0082_01500 [Candidatus Haliotispira prima]|uniref:PEGA domain-containing protein n=1 Tax=Candidatus Haliotispira prima TaxID=3034016 RepID=A0ABY8MHS9_9SPIO|nr:hypothetical protein P0082_01500 [Candidatus Haliotispira prima]
MSVLSVVLGLLFALHTQMAVLEAQNNVGQLPVINIQKTGWKVLFQGFVSQPGSAPPSSEVEKITGRLAKSLRKLGEHVLDENEKNDLREKAIREELYKHYKKYTSLVEQRDRDALNATLKRRSGFAQITAQGNRDSKISQEGRLIRRIQNMNRELISVPDSLPLEFTDRSLEPHVPPNIVLLRDDYDVFIWGVASGRGNVFQVEMRAYIANAGREVSLWKGIVGSDNYEDSLEMIYAGVTSLLLGRPWAAMRIEVVTEVETGNDPDAKIYLDGSLQGENNLTLYGLYPERAYELEIIATGLQGKYVFIEPEAGKLNSFQFKLDIEVPEKFITVKSSEPADVYLGVRFLGETPLEIQVPAYETLLVLVARDKSTVNYDLSPEQEKDLFFKMEKAPEITLKEENDKWRTRFYWSSALFMISLALPVISAGIGFVNQGLYVNNQNNSEGAGYQQSMLAGFGVAIGGGVISGILLGLNIYDFTRYTKSTRALTSTEFKPRKVLPGEAEVRQPDVRPDTEAGQAQTGRQTEEAR